MHNPSLYENRITVLKNVYGKRRQMCFLILNKEHTTYFTVECALKIFPTSVLFLAILLLFLPMFSLSPLNPRNFLLLQLVQHVL